MNYRSVPPSYLRRHYLGLLLLLLAMPPRLSAEEALTLLPRTPQGFVRLRQAAEATEVLRLEASEDLRRWEEIGRGHGGLSAYPDFLSVGAPRRFYRSLRQPLTTEDDWKNQARFSDDLFLSSPTYSFQSVAEARWIKFAIVLDQTNKVYFQDSRKYLFHYDFAVRRLAAFERMSRAEFDAVSLRLANQKVVLGALLFPPGAEIRELGIQLVGQEPYAGEALVAWLNLVKAVLDLPADVEVRYFPVFEQSQAAASYRPFLEAHGILLGSVARWMTADQGYATGWALGRLVYVPAGEINQAYTDGRLTAADILLTDAVPAEIPPVAGVITLSPATPNSHVALLAQSFGVPFAFFADAAEQARLRGATNRMFVLRVDTRYGVVSLKAADVQGQLTPELQASIQSLKIPPLVEIVPKAAAGKFSVSTEDLNPADIRYVGGKAAHYGLLRRAVPTNCPEAIAFTFDLWDAYLDQTLADGKTLRAAIRERLGAYSYPPNMSHLRADLAEIRNWFTDRTIFTPEQERAILAALSGFEPNRKIRFRSSTNVEDGESFSGAGLYDSFSGCLADDLDADTGGPCHCDAAEPKERGVFRALKKVYASFYNDNAFLERLRHRIDEDQAGMGVLAHVSTPDEIELANGVATVVINRDLGGGVRYTTLTLVSQAGAVSVANPEPNARPEKVTGSKYGDPAPYLEVAEHSGLVPLGGTVMTWPSDYQNLAGLLDRACRGYENIFPQKTKFWLDLEYKKIAPGFLEIKQIRAIPQPDATRQTTAYLLHQPNAYMVLQGERGDAFGIHRLKSRWSFQTRNLRLDTPGECVFQGLTAEYVLGGESLRYDGAVTNLPGFVCGAEAESRSLQWTWGAGTNARALNLSVALPSQVASDQSPLFFLDDAALTLRANYAHDQPSYAWDGAGQTRSDEVTLVPATQPGPGSSLQQRKISGTNLVVKTSFYWPPPPTGPTAGYTAPAQAWVETTLEGLASQPIRLTSDPAQTYHAGHHNFFEEFIFDPSLEPGLSPEIRGELERRNIRALYVSTGLGSAPRFVIWGWDNQLRVVDTGAAEGK